MKKPVFDYFKNLHEVGLKIKDGTIIETSKNVSEINPHVSSSVKEILINKDRIFYSKNWDGQFSACSIGTSKMYNDIGILTPPVFVMKSKTASNSPWSTAPQTFLRTITEDVRSIDGYQLKQADKVLNAIIYDLNMFLGQWDMVNIRTVRNALLAYMTPECLDELTGMFLIDELRTEIDRHTQNYFLARKPNSPFWEHVIPIDNELTHILYNYSGTSYFNMFFENLLKQKYSSYTVTERMSCSNYIERMRDMMDLVHEGKLSKENISLLKKTLAYDYAGTIKKCCSTKDLNPYKDNLYSLYSRLWDYNRENLGKELGM